MNLKKYISMAGVVLGMGLTSCVGDLDLQPNDPNLVNPYDPNFTANSLEMCYSGIAVSGISGAGSSYVSGLDPGTSAYLRLIFTLNEFCSDELLWIWPDAGVVDITSCTWGINNGLLEGVYYRLLGHIAICNQYLANTAGDTDAESQQMRAEARVLRAYSYYNMLDLFGQSSFITEEAAVGESPVQLSRKELYDWLEQELVDIVDNKLISETPVYGRVGLDGAEGLLARLYLNAEVYSGTGEWAKCQERCENIIERHKGGGFEGSGLANHYLYLFARDNDAYMPGGSKKDENEILFGIAYDDTMTQSYGGPTFIIASTISNTHYIPRQNYGCSGEWSCIRGCQEMAERFYGISDADVRDDLWLRGYLPAGSNGSESWDAEDYSDRFVDFTGAWATTGGNAIIKFTGRTRNAAEDGGWDMTLNADGTYTCGFPATTFGSTDQPIIRLADIYLMYSECYVNGNTGDRQKALDYINLVRRRAGAPSYGFTDLTKKGIMDERSRELYLESTRRTDLIRNGMFVGPSQTVWQYKGSINNNAGTRIDERNALYPIPYAVIAAQPEFKQNPGY
ncbi:MAG: RagB/SusD family nutrient uptake outer membrane protein [Muribaculaceae bacterium]|nr:RagB/SusD family nutrient uptake outer membrane protein [Muribaculaceae bacterium]